MPPGNLRKGGILFVEIGELKPGTPFVNRPSPPVGNNPGGGIEVVVAPGGLISAVFRLEGANHDRTL